MNTTIIQQQERRQLRPKGGRTGKAAAHRALKTHEQLAQEPTTFQQKIRSMSGFIIEKPLTSGYLMSI